MAINKPKIQVQLDIPRSINNINADLKQLESQLKPINIKYNFDTSSANGIQQSTVKITKSTQDLSQQLGNLQNRATGAYGSFIKYLQQNSQIAEKLPAQVNAIKESYTSLKNETDFSKAQQGYKNLTSSITALRGEARMAGMEGRTWLGELGNDLQKFATWFSVGGAVTLGISEIRQMVSNVQDLDKAMTDIQIASGMSTSEVQKLMTTYSQMGQTLGATTVEVANSADSYLRQGKSIAETNELVKDSMMLSKLSQIESSQATDYLTASMKGYGVATKDAISIVDKLTAVDMESATSAGGLAEGMAQVANNASMAGISMDKLIGYLAVVGETTGESMSSVGNGLSTMLSRMGNIKLSRLTDPTTGEDLSNVETTLKRLGISLRDSNDTFRSFGDTLDDVGSKWKTYSDVDKRSIAVSIAGKDHMEEFLVLMNNYNTALKYQTTAEQSAGTATQKMSIYTDSLESHTKAATAAFEELSKAVINGDIFKGIIDAGGTLSNVLSSIVKSGAGIPALIASISAGMSIAGKNAGKEYAPFLRVA